MDLERFWLLLAEGNLDRILTPDCTWDDPLFDAAAGDAVRASAIPRLARWYRERAASGAVQHLRTTIDDRRVAVEHVLALRDGLVWNQAEQKAEKAARIELAAAVVGDRVGDGFGAVRVYFGTWAVLDGVSRFRAGPICPDERAATRAAMEAVPVVRKYFDGLRACDPALGELFEPDGYFREPANNFVSGPVQLREHFAHVFASGGVEIEFLTATRQGNRLGLELQTVKWGSKKTDRPQAGFAIYELGPHGKLQGGRVYDSAVPPA